jgi:GxxExxY protein
MRPNQITQNIIGCAIEVHRHLGPGLLENAYEVALCRELDLQGISYQRQKRLPLHYKGIDLALSYRIDILVAETVVVEVKAVEKVLPIHEAQLLTLSRRRALFLAYLKLGGYQVGLLLNFNVSQLRNGIVRRVLGLQE